MIRQRMNKSSAIAMIVALLCLLTASMAQAAKLGSFNQFRINDYVYVVSGTDPEIILVHIERERVQATIKLPHIPTGVIVAEQLSLLIATDPATKHLWLLDPAKRVMLKELKLDIEPTLIALHPDEESVAIADWTSGIVEIYSLPDAKLLGRIEGLQSAHELRFSPNGKKLYVSLTDKPEISVLDLENYSITKRIQMGGTKGIEQLVMSATSPFALAVPIPSDEAEVYMIDLDSDELIGTMDLDEAISRAFTDAFGKYIFLASVESGLVQVFDVRSREIVREIEFTAPISSITSGFLGTIFYALSAEEKTAWGLDLETFSVIDKIKLPGLEPDTMITDEQSGKIFITIEDEMEIVIVDTRVPKGKRPAMRLMWVPDKMPMQVVVPGALAFCR